MSSDVLEATLRRIPSDATLHQRLLRHVAEEARHALFFKAKARELGQDPDAGFAPESVLVPRISGSYLRRLDVVINRHIKEAFPRPRRKQHLLAYLLTTLLIELRADEIYPMYERILRERGGSLSVRSIIAEEVRHLREIEAMLEQELGADAWSTVEALRREESLIFQKWILALHVETSSEAHPSVLTP